MYVYDTIIRALQTHLTNAFVAQLGYTSYVTADYMFQAAIASITDHAQVFAILFVCSLQFDTIYLNMKVLIFEHVELH